MVSQTWRGPKDVDRAVWQHWLAFAYPEKVRSPIGFLFIGGGRNGSSPPDGPSERVQRIAQATGTAVAELHMVPNQPLVFHGDGEDRVEDDLIGYTWDQFLKTGDPSWPAQNAMAKSAVRAMDTMTALMASATGGGQRVDRFVVAGGSKRGWTTWLTGAVDKRVVAIVPIVIDVLNVKQSMLHHFAAYGFWAPSVGDYVHHGLMERLDHPRLEALYQLVDPYSYRHRLTMPKFVLNAAGDQFFLPDSSQFYWDGLEGEKCLRYVPNADHGLEGSDALKSLTAFYTLILAGRRAPEFSWREEKDGALSVSVKDAPQEVRLWQATNPRARDFRVETLGRKFTSTVLESRSPGVYVASVPPPEKGWTAYFVELTYEVGAPVPLKLTTNVRVAPDVLPYRDRDSSQPGTVTVVCAARDEDSARAIVEEAGAFVAEKKFSKNGVTTKRIGTTCYLNWRPSGSAERGGRALTEWLRERGAEGFRYQLESGETITME
jgi:PhoPQ-activated pathogenicity-related protein